MFHPTVIPSILLFLCLFLNICLIINSQHLSICESLNDIDGNEIEKNNSQIKSRSIRALCDAIHSSRAVSEQEELKAIPDFDLTQISSGTNSSSLIS